MVLPRPKLPWKFRLPPDYARALVLLLLEVLLPVSTLPPLLRDVEQRGRLARERKRRRRRSPRHDCLWGHR